MAVLMVSCGLVIGGDATEGQYLRRFDADAYDGRGRVEWTSLRWRAMRFADVGPRLAFVGNEDAEA